MILQRLIRSEAMSHELEIEQAFNRLYHMCLIEVSPDVTLMECYVMFKVLKERFHTFSWLIEQDDVVYDVTMDKVYLDDNQKETAKHHQPLAKHYIHCREPMWDTLKATFDPLILEQYPGEDLIKRHPDLPSLHQLLDDYVAEASHMAGRRRPQR
ncbi:DNA-directed RNA polymerase subunit A'' [Striga asiatica]|uniref:DNA-directed RNA polymerase subunit A n=1 Tax=Striga asiatica TaxID=4170 RepID=A0A5A7QAG3_STRAF|nr:DNA-directed RNA polymerase subunit A'' [Striga asiatica]